MNTPVPVEMPQNAEQQMEVLLARIEEKMAHIRHDREEGEAIMEQTRQLAQSNARALAELGEIITRMK